MYLDLCFKQCMSYTLKVFNVCNTYVCSCSSPSFSSLSFSSPANSSHSTQTAIERGEAANMNVFRSRIVLHALAALDWKVEDTTPDPAVAAKPLNRRNWFRKLQ